MSTSNTPNYNWVIPGDDENIRDGADAIRSLGTAVDRDLKALANQKPNLSPYQTASAHATAMASKATITQLNNMVLANGAAGRRVRSGSAFIPSLGVFNNFTFTAYGLTIVEVAVLTNGDITAAQGIAVSNGSLGNAVTGALVSPTGASLAGRAARINWVAVGA